VRICYNNFWDDYTIAATTESSNYPKENTQDPRLSYYTLTTSVSNQYWTINLGSAQVVNCACIAGHNLTSGATIRVEGSSDNFATIHFTSTITDWMVGPIVHFFASQTYRYWRFFISDAANPDLFIQVGRFFIGTYLQVTPSSEVPVSVGTFDTSKVSFSISGQSYLDKGLTGQIYGFKFPNTTYAQKVLVDAFYDEVSIGLPFFFVNTENNYSVFVPLYCVLENPIEWEYKGQNIFTYRFSIKEVY
jgi:hypothetical protein